jgi:putative heme iron utilization protein
MTESDTAATPTGAFRFDDATVAGVTAHMNADHADDTLLICRALGDRDAATAATMIGLDGDGGDYRVTIDGDDETIRIPWGRPLTERAEIRQEVVRMYEAACAQLGLVARGH